MNDRGFPRLGGWVDALRHAQGLVCGGVAEALGSVGLGLTLALPFASQVPLDESLLRLPSPHLYSGDPEHEINGVYTVLSSLLTKFIHCSRNIIEQVLGARA